MSKIQWTDETWNCVTGCTRASEGCDHCYAATMTKRLAAMGQEKYQGLVGNGHFNGVVKTWDDELSKPLRWKKPRMVFVNSMSDLFHHDVPDAFIRKVFAIMSMCGQHTFQVLTKRAARLGAWFADEENSLSACQAELIASDWWCDARPDRTPANRDRIRDKSQINGAHRGFGDGNYWPLGNVWIGVSCENQEQADKRIPHLLRCPAAIRFVSAEPLLSEINIAKILISEKLAHYEQFEDGDLLHCMLSRQMTHAWLDWCIIGGESGPGARPCDINWIRSIVEQCKAAGVAPFVKQLGANATGQTRCKRCGRAGGDWSVLQCGDKEVRCPNCPGVMPDAYNLNDSKGGDISEFPEDLRIREFPEASQ